MSAISPACAAPACALAIPPAPDNTYADFLASAERAGRFIVEISAFPKDAAPVSYTPLPACGAPACSLGATVGTPATAVLLSFSDHLTPFEPNDELKPHYVPDPRLARRVDIDTAFSIVPTTSAGGQVLVGDIELFNADAGVDDYVSDWAIDGRPVRILFGPEYAPYRQYRVVEQTFGKDWRGDPSEIRLSVQDLQFRLDQQFVSTTYAGTGGMEGDATLTGVLKPRLMGYRWNFTPRRISVANEIWQLNNGPIQEVITVRDGGAALTDSGIDVTSYNALVAADLEEGEYATALSLGLIRVRPAGGSLASVLSVEARGDNSNGYAEGVGAIIVKELRDRAGFQDTEIDAGSFAPLDAYTTGYWFSGETEKTFRDVFSELTVQTNGRIIADSRIRAARILDPANVTFSNEFTEDQIVTIEPEGVIYAPIKKVTVRYKPNDAVLSESQILDSVDEPDFSDLQKPYLEVFRRNGVTALRHIGAQPEVTISTNLTSETSALALLENVANLWQTERMTFTVKLNREGLFLAVGSVIKITYPRYGFAAGRNALIIRKLNNYNEQQAELRVLV